MSEVSKEMRLADKCLENLLGRMCEKMGYMLNRPHILVCNKCTTL
jgi:hypothetical protein